NYVDFPVLGGVAGRRKRGQDLWNHRSCPPLCSMHADVSFKAGGDVLSIMREKPWFFAGSTPCIGLISMKRTLSLSLLAIAGLCLSQLGCGEDKPTGKAGIADKAGTAAELKIEDLKEGTGPAVKAGDT